MAVELLSLGPVFILLLLANYTERRKDLRILTKVFLLLSVLALMLEGVAVLALKDTGLVGGPSDLSAFGCGLLLTGAVALAAFFRSSRELLARVMDIDPENWLHATAVVLFIVLVGASLTIAFSYEDVIEMGGKAGVSTASVLLQDVVFALFALFGVGWMTRRRLGQVLKRLGFVKPSLRDIAMALAFLLLFFLILTALHLVQKALDPGKDPFDVGEDPTVKLLGGVTVLSAIAISLGSGICEELLFRGAMQPRFGIALTSVAFTLGHVQYPDLPSICALLAMSVILGFERKLVNTTACVITHACYNLIPLLAFALS